MPRSPQDRVKVNLFLQADVLAALKKMATIRGTTYSDLVREACRRFVVAEAGKLIEDQKQLDALRPAPSRPMTWEEITPSPPTADDSDPRERE